MKDQALQVEYFTSIADDKPGVGADLLQCRRGYRRRNVEIHGSPMVSRYQLGPGRRAHRNLWR